MKERIVDSAPPVPPPAWAYGRVPARLWLYGPVLLACGPAAVASTAAIVAALTHQPLADATRILIAHDLHLASTAIAAYWLVKLVINRPGAAITSLGLACAAAGASLAMHLFGFLPGTFGQLTQAGHEVLFAGVLLWLTRELFHRHHGRAHRAAAHPVAGWEGSRT